MITEKGYMTTQCEWAWILGHPVKHTYPGIILFLKNDFLPNKSSEKELKLYNIFFIT